MDQDQLIKLVRTYRLSEGLAEQLRLGDEIFRIIEPQLRLFVFAAVAHPAADDTLQETLRAIAIGLSGFAGSSVPEFWGWSYRIARNKINDYLRKQMAERLQPLPPEELWRLVEVSVHHSPLSPAEVIDLEEAMALLRDSRPECYQYLWKHFVIGLDYGEIAEEQNLSYDNVRMRISRCLDAAHGLVS